MSVKTPGSWPYGLFVLWMTLALLPSSFAFAEEEGTGRISLAEVMIPRDVPFGSYVHYGLEELGDYLRAHGGACRTATTGEMIRGKGLPILLGLGRGSGRSAVSPGLDVLGQEGFLVAEDELLSRPALAVVAHHPQGLKFGLIELIKAIQTDEEQPYLNRPLPRRNRPRFGRRGMYAHLHWQYHHPYACRSWSEEDWKRYIDLLSYFGCNVLQCWPMAAMCPTPLSDSDRAYLEKYERVIDYAHRCRGMEVWPGEAPNNVAEDDKGVPIERRRYFDVEVKKDPGDRDQLDQVMANREAFYRAVPNGDAYWVIDSDPGGWKGSPSREFVDILLRNRMLLDRCASDGTQTGLIYWMWQGWGIQDARLDNLRDVLADMRGRLREPWMLHACDVNHLKLAAEMGLEHKCVYYPYSTIEHEPSWPITALYYDRIRRVLHEVDAYPKLIGVLGNAQTPLVQLPNIYFFTSSCWEWDRLEREDESVLRELAGWLLPDLETELVNAWLALPVFDSQRVAAALNGLEGKVRASGVGRSGPVGRLVVPRPSQMVDDLLFVLRMHLAACRLVDSWREGCPARQRVRQDLEAFLDAGLAWFQHTGFERQVVFHFRTFGIDFLKVGEAIDRRVEADDASARLIHEVLNDLYPTLAERYSARRVHEVLWRMAGDLYPDLLRASEAAVPGHGNRVIEPAGADVDIELVRIPGGTFRMGSPSDEAGRRDDEGPVHEVTVAPFWIGRYEVTNRQFRAFRPKHNPPLLEGLSFHDPDQPAVYVSWLDAQAFCVWLSERTGRPFTLPTEAQWEYAARGGAATVGILDGGQAAGCRQANVADRSAARYWPNWPVLDCDDGYAVTAPVGQFEANPLCLHDMIGNVWEWCADWYAPDAYTAAPARNPVGPRAGAGHVIRGGSWSSGSRCVRFATRDHAGPNDRHGHIGFRVCVPDDAHQEAR